VSRAFNQRLSIRFLNQTPTNPLDALAARTVAAADDDDNDGFSLHANESMK